MGAGLCGLLYSMFCHRSATKQSPIKLSADRQTRTARAEAGKDMLASALSAEVDPWLKRQDRYVLYSILD